MKQITSLFFLLLIYINVAAQEGRPNFVIIIGDDVGWNDLGCYGNRVVHTPNIDQLAQEGVRFNNAYLTASSCSPSRCSIIAGRYPHNTGAAELHTPLPQGMATLPGALKKAGYYTVSAGKWHLGPNAIADFDLVVQKGNGSGGEDQWLRVLKERPANKPFFFWFASHDAHRPWQADDFMTSHNPDEVVVPPYLVDAPGTRQDLASYYNEIQRLDFYVGEVKKELAAQHVLDNTLLLVMSDNGRPFPRCKTRVYDSGMKTPLIIRWPHLQSGSGQLCNSLISVIDIAPTFLSLAGVEAVPGFQGVSFAKCIHNPKMEHRNYVFSEHNWHDYEAHERMVRTKYFLYLVNNRPQLSNQGPADSNRSPAFTDLKGVRDRGLLNAAQADVFMAPRPNEELYDCIHDPQQLINIASDPQYLNIMQDLRAVMLQWIQDTGDDVPAHLTGDAFDRESGALLPGVERFNTVERGEMPGSSHHATKINRKGPI